MEDHRLEMHLNTAQMLQELDFIDDKNLKISYNYNCETNRVNYDFKLLAQEELQERRNDPKIIGLQSKIAKENSLAYVKKKQLTQRLLRVLDSQF